MSTTTLELPTPSATEPADPRALVHPLVAPGPTRCGSQLRAGRRHRSTTVPTLLPTLALALVAVLWGVTFTVVDDATTVMNPTDLVAWRFGLAALVLTLVTSRARRLPPALLGRAVALGGLLGTGFLLQTWGLTYTDALTSGFLTSLLVVIAPVAGWLIFRDRLSPASWLGVGVAAGGLVLLSWHEAHLGRGELLTLLAATAWGLHVVLLSRWARAEHALALARVQTVTVAAMALLVIALRSVVLGGSPLPELPPDAQSWWSVVFLAVLATAAAMVLLSWSQARVGSTRAAVVLTLEPAVAGATAVLAGTDPTLRTLLGAGALLLAIYLVELSGRRVVATRRSDGLQESCKQPSSGPDQPCLINTTAPEGTAMYTSRIDPAIATVGLLDPSARPDHLRQSRAAAERHALLQALADQRRDRAPGRRRDRVSALRTRRPAPALSQRPLG